MKKFTPLGSLFEYYSISNSDAAKIVNIINILDTESNEKDLLSKFAKGYCFLGMELFISFFHRYKAIVESLNGKLHFEDYETIQNYSAVESVNFILLLMSLTPNTYIEFLYWLCSFGKFQDFDRGEFISFALLFNKMNGRTSIFKKAKINIDFINSGNYQILKLEHIKLFDLKFGGSLCMAFGSLQKLIQESTFGKAFWLQIASKVQSNINRVLGISGTTLHNYINYFSLSFSLEKRCRKILRRVLRILVTLKLVFGAVDSNSNTVNFSFLSFFRRKAKVYPGETTEQSKGSSELIDSATNTYLQVSDILSVANQTYGNLYKEETT